jgi:uncharacterized protein YggE
MLSPFTLTVLSAILMAGHDPQGPDRVIRVSGDGVATAAPDLATIHTGVVSRKASAGEAIAANNQAMKEVLQTLKDGGIAEKDIQTANFHVRPIYERDDRGRTDPGVQAYEVSNQVRVRVRDLGRLGAVLDAVVKAGGNRISGIEFKVSDPVAAVDEARKHAVADARHRAAVLAKEAGVAVGKVVSITEQSHHIPQPLARARGMVADAAAIPIQSGQNEFRVSVQVAFAIADSGPSPR